ncbi:MAG: hypothetical protein OHK0019_07980 [Saprospiraceae bacterium]
MKITAFVFCLFCSGILSAQVADTSKTDSLPTRQTTVITYDSTFYDFGTVKQGVVVKRTFRFTNTGADSLRISNVKVTCGCTVPEWPKKPIPPGGKGEIKVEFNTADKVGRQLRILRVVANTEPEETLLQLGGEIKVAKKKKPRGG